MQVYANGIGFSREKFLVRLGLELVTYGNIA
jgi:hypothetical protein